MTHEEMAPSFKFKIGDIVAFVQTSKWGKATLHIFAVSLVSDGHRVERKYFGRVRSSVAEPIDFRDYYENELEAIPQAQKD